MLQIERNDASERRFELSIEEDRERTTGIDGNERKKMKNELYILFRHYYTHLRSCSPK